MKLLLVHHDEAEAEAIRQAFRHRGPDLTIETVAQGPETLNRLSQIRYDAVILNHHPSQIDALRLLSLIRSGETPPPVIMLIPPGIEAQGIEALRGGADHYIPKTDNYPEALALLAGRLIDMSQRRDQLELAAVRGRKLYEVFLAVTRERQLETLGQVLVRGAAQVLGVQAAALFVLNPEGAEITWGTSFGIRFEQELIGPIRSAGLLGLACTERRPIVVEAAPQHAYWRSTPGHAPSIFQILSVPLQQEGQVTGAFSVMNKEDGQPFTLQDTDTLATLAMHAAVAMDNARFILEMEMQAVTDSLTGLYNHREFQKRLHEEVERANRYGHELSLLMVDIDHFKVINDTHGHAAGDALLREFASMLLRCIRNVDLAARYGGEEFSVILPETGMTQANIVAERIRNGVDGGPLLSLSGHPVHISVSIGVATFPRDGTLREQLILSADEALYFSKEAGRNRTCHYGDTLKSTIERSQEKLIEILQDPKLKTLRDLAAAIDAKSPYTRGHTDQIVESALKLAEALQLTPEDKKSLQLASLLHNIGTVSIPDTLLNKPTPLSVEELKIIQAHPVLAQMLIKGSSKLEAILPAILYHHERFDGHGYPNGLRGREIPFLARILSVVESYHAMISIRPYRPRLTQQQAVEELRRNSGTQFDPQIVEAFMSLVGG